MNPNRISYPLAVDQAYRKVTDWHPEPFKEADFICDASGNLHTYSYSKGIHRLHENTVALLHFNPVLPLHIQTMVLLTIAQAARTVGVARSTIYSHLQLGKLSATRTPTGERRIDTRELSRVYGAIDPTTQSDVVSPTPQDIALLQAKIESLEAQNILLQDEVEAGREEKAKLLDVISRGLLEGPKAKRRKGKKKEH